MKKLKRIWFFANQSKTFFFERLAKTLRQRGFDVGFVTTNLGWKRYLEGQSFEVLLLRGEPDVDELELAPLNSENIAWLIQIDRNLCKVPNWKALRAIGRINSGIKRHSSRLRHSIVLGEMTWTAELLTWSYQQRFQFSYFNPHSIRFPSERFAFFADPAETLVANVQADSERSYANSNEKTLFWKDIKPGDLVSKFMLLFLSDVWDLGDPSGRFFPMMLYSWLRKKIRLAAFKNSYTLSTQSETTKSKALYVCLHIEPERSVYGFLPPGLKQCDFVRQMIDTYGKDFPTVICLHPRETDLRAYPGIQRITEGRDFSIICGIDVDGIHPDSIVCSISGSVLREAGERRLRTVSAVDFYLTTGLAFHNSVYKYPFLADISNKLAVPPSVIRPNDKGEIASFDGIIADPYFVPASIGQENIKRVSDAIEKLAKVID